MGQTLGIDFRKLRAVVKHIETVVPSIKIQLKQVKFDKNPVMCSCVRLAFDRKPSLSPAELAESLSETILEGKWPGTVAGPAINVCAYDEHLAGRVPNFFSLLLRYFIEFPG